MPRHFHVVVPTYRTRNATLRLFSFLAVQIRPLLIPAAPAFITPEWSHAPFRLFPLSKAVATMGTFPSKFRSHHRTIAREYLGFGNWTLDSSGELRLRKPRLFAGAGWHLSHVPVARPEGLA
jgi:hypothetical protein